MKTKTNGSTRLPAGVTLGEEAALRIIREEEVLKWDEVAQREAMLLYPAADSFVTTLLRGSCYTTETLGQVMRIVEEELKGDAHELAKAIYLRHSRGFPLEEIGPELLEGFTTSAFGPGSFYSVASEAVDGFSSLLGWCGRDSCWILAIQLPEGYYLVADPG